MTDERIELADAVCSSAEVKMGDALAAIGRRIGLTDKEADCIVSARQRAVVGAMWTERRRED